MMCRETYLVLILILLGGGCGRKSAPPQAQTARASKAPTARAPSRAPQVSQKAAAVALQPAVVINPAEAKDPVGAARLFLQAIATAQYDGAVALCVPGKFTAQGFRGMALTFQMDKASLGQAWAGGKVAAVVTGFVPTKQGTVAGAVWGLKLVPAEGGHWSIRDVDFLPNQQAVDKYLAAFREGEPDARSIPL
jgi:hypothetical protein